MPFAVFSRLGFNIILFENFMILIINNCRDAAVKDETEIKIEECADTVLQNLIAEDPWVMIIDNIQIGDVYT